MEDRLTSMERDLVAVKADVATIRSNYATKADLANVQVEMLKVMNAQVIKFVTWVTSAMALMTTAVYFIARNVH